MSFARHSLPLFAYGGGIERIGREFELHSIQGRAKRSVTFPNSAVTMPKRSVTMDRNTQLARSNHFRPRGQWAEKSARQAAAMNGCHLHQLRRPMLIGLLDWV